MSLTDISDLYNLELKNLLILYLIIMKITIIILKLEN